MTLTNYWIALIWVMVAGMLLDAVVPKTSIYVCGIRKYRWNTLAAIIVVAPLIIWAANRGQFADTVVYRQMFFSAPTTLGEIPAYVAQQTKDVGFFFVTALMRTVLDSDVVYFFLIALFQLGLMALVFRKYSINYWFSMFLFVASADYFSWTFNGIRQFIAVIGIFACTKLMLKRKYIPLIAIILLISTIHGSALIMIPIIIISNGRAWNKKTLLFIAAMAVAIVFIEQFTPLLSSVMAETQYSDMMTNDTWLNDNGTNILRVLVYSVPAMMSWVGRRNIEKSNDPVINFSVNMSICSAAFYFLSSVTSGVFMGRIPIYMSLYSYICLPWLIENMFTKQLSRLVYILAVAAYIIFFYYQMFIAW